MVEEDIRHLEQEIRENKHMGLANGTNYLAERLQRLKQRLKKNNDKKVKTITEIPKTTEPPKTAAVIKSETNALIDPPVPTTMTCEICKKAFKPVDAEHICPKCMIVFNQSQGWLDFFAEMIPWLIIVLPLLVETVFLQMSWLWFGQVAMSSFVATLVIYLKKRFGNTTQALEKKVAELQAEVQRQALCVQFAVASKDDAMTRLADMAAANLGKTK